MHNNFISGIPINNDKGEGQVLQAWTAGSTIITYVDIQHNIFVDNHQALVFPFKDTRNIDNSYSHFTGIIQNNIFKQRLIGNPTTSDTKTQHYPAMILFTNSWFTDTFQNSSIFVDCPHWYKDENNFHECNKAVKQLDSQIQIANNTILLPAEMTSISLFDLQEEYPDLNLYRPNEYLNKFCSSPTFRPCSTPSTIPYFININNGVLQSTSRRRLNVVAEVFNNMAFVGSYGLVGRLGSSKKGEGIDGALGRRVLQSTQTTELACRYSVYEMAIELLNPSVRSHSF